MPSVKRRVKRETRVVEVREGRLKATEPNRLDAAVQNMVRMLPKSAPSVSVSPDGGNCRPQGRDRR
jgi:hypothetical protein